MKTGHNIVPVDPYLEVLMDTQEKKKKRENWDSCVFLENKRTRDVVLNYHRNKETQLLSWNNNVLGFEQLRAF